MSEEIEGPKILGVLYILFALPLLIGYAMALGWAMVYYPSELSLLPLAFLVVFVAVPISIGWGLASVKRWGWFAAIAYNVLAVAAVALGYLYDYSVIWAIAVTVYLLTPRVRDAFGVDISEPAFLSQ